MRTIGPFNVRSVVSKSVATVVNVSYKSARAGLHFLSASIVAWLVIASTTMPTIIKATVVNARNFLIKTMPSELLASSGSKFTVVVPVTLRISVRRPPPVTVEWSTPRFLGT